MNAQLESPTIPNLEAVKARQKATWESGDFGQIARTIENVAEEFMARQPIEPGARPRGRGRFAHPLRGRGCRGAAIRWLPVRSRREHVRSNVRAAAQHRTAELLRVTQFGGPVALANWTPEGFIGK